MRKILLWSELLVVIGIIAITSPHADASLQKAREQAKTRIDAPATEANR